MLLPISFFNSIFTSQRGLKTNPDPRAVLHKLITKGVETEDFIEVPDLKKQIIDSRTRNQVTA